MSDRSADELSPNKRALLKIRQLKEQLADAQQVSGGPIAIVSMACRFPRRSRTPEAFFQSLLDGADEVSDVPADRWDLDAFYDEDPDVPGKMYARRGVFLEGLDLMDPEFFGISPREATWVDPQQRLLLEVGWEALERAGWPTERIREQTGIFVGWMHNDYQNEASDSFLNLNPYIATGAAGSFLCGRLAYYLGLEGPSVAVDTACSSSLVALHLACQSLQRGDCDRALVGGVNAIISPTTNILTCKLKALSPHGHSRAFDAAADGYLRGEGCGVVTLRRLVDAERDGDPIVGIIRGSSVGHNGFSSGLTAPNPRAQARVIRQALERAGIEPKDIAYLEAHGTGTELGDPIEMQAAAAVLTQDRAGDHPLLVGSVKTNIGHLEAAAGMAGLIKVLLAMEHNTLPSQLNFEEPNPHIPWDKIPVKVVTEATTWPDSSTRQLAGVSAFGMSGTNAHVVIEGPNGTSRHLRPAGLATSADAAQRQLSDSTKTQSELIVLSSKSNEALPILAENLGRQLSADASLRVPDVAYTSCLGRTHFEYRAALVVSSRDQAIDALRVLSRSGEAEFLFQGSGRRTPKVAWQFTGQGSQYIGMAQGLYDTQAAFREAIDRCDRLIREWRKQSLIEVLFEGEGLIDHTSWTQPCIFATQMGLAGLLESWGLQPDVVLGHSVGQYAAACVAGIMSWEDGLYLISERGRLIGELPPGGRMLAIFAPVELVKETLALSPEVSLAALNGTHVVVSGPAAAIETVNQQFAARSIRTKSLTTSHAFHSSLMDPAVEAFQTVADTVTFQPGRLPLICNVTGKPLEVDCVLDGEYWSRHIREAVRFSDCTAAVHQAGCDLILELGPQSVLTGMAAANWSGSPSGLISCLQKGRDDVESLFRAIAQLYVQGVALDFAEFLPKNNRRRVVLPTYPFQRRRFWGPDKPRAAHAAFHSAHPLLGKKISLAGVSGEIRYESFIESDSPSWLLDHEVMGQVVFPGAGYIEMALAAAGSAQVDDIVFESPLQLTSRTSLQTVVTTAAEQKRTIETFSTPVGHTHWTRNFKATISDSQKERPEPLVRADLEAECTEVAAPADFYRKMLELGLHYGNQFQTINSIRYSKTAVLTHLKTPGDIRGYSIPPTLVDGAFHSLAVGLLTEDDGDLFLPVGIGRVTCFQSVLSEVWCYARWKESAGKVRSADLVLFTETGQVVATIDDLRVQQVSRAVLRQMGGSGSGRVVYQLAWQDLRLPASTAKETNWLIIRSSNTCSGLSSALVAKLTGEGHRVVELNLQADVQLPQFSESLYQISGQRREEWDQLFDQLSSESPYVPDGIAWLLGDTEKESGTGRNSKSSTNGSLPTGTRSNCTSLLHLIAAMHGRRLRRLECGLQLITGDAMSLNGDASADAQQAQYWGLGRVIGAELPELRCRLIDINSDRGEEAATAEALVDILLTETRDSQLAVRDQQFFVPRIRQVPLNHTGHAGLNIRSDGCYLITGGLGMLGLQAAKWLAAKGAKQVVLVSRRPADEAKQAFLETIQDVGCEVVVHAADTSARRDIEGLFDRFGQDLQQLKGVIHAAGVLDDALLADQNWSRFEKVLAPKVIGATLLHEFTKSLSLDFFVLYSSAAAVLGSPGQSNYATANAYLDGLAWHRRGLGLPGVSINWGPWTAGMADDERIRKRLALQGITPLTVDEAHSAMEKILEADLPQATVMDVDWRRLRMGGGGESSAILDEVTPVTQKAQVGDSELVGKLKRLGGSAQKELLVKSLQTVLQEVLSMPAEPDIDRPLIEMGLDSLMAVEFGSHLQQLLGEQLAIGPTIVFDHPTIDAIANYVLELITEEFSEQQPTVEEPAKPRIEQLQPAREDIAIIGMSCRFPGAQDVHEFWENLVDGVDSVCPIPDDRWDVDRFYSPEKQLGKMHSREGGFLEDIGDFDAAFFNVSDLEACWIDPQHRLLLENSYRALEDAGIATHPLGDTNVGVFMGIMGQDYAFLPSLDDADVIRAFQGAGLSHSAGVGRISHLFGFEGPSIAVDTASSSSLVALIQAVRSLQEGNCNLALAGAANAILAPVNSLLMSKAGLLAPDGRCKSFSAQANGFGRGEGCGVVVLKRLSDARRDGDRIMAMVCGGAVVHNGFSGGITTPSARSQTRVIGKALADAGIAPSQVQYLEAHGTGTEYGDSMELAAAASVYGKGRKADEPLLVGSVKANISHLEAAGGISGLIKTVLALQHETIPPQLHFAEPSAHIPWGRLPVRIVTEETAWPAAERRFAAVTALGLVGTNAHVILSSPTTEQLTSGAQPSADSELADRPTQLMVLSARNEAALAALANSYQQFFAKHIEVDVADICHTLAIGRRHYEHRVAFTVTSQSEAIRKLACCADTADDCTTAALGNGDSGDGDSAGGDSHSNGSIASARKGIAKNVSNSAPKIAWTFTADNESRFRSARELYRVEPVFRDFLNSLDARLADHFAERDDSTPGLLDWLISEDPSGKASDLHLFAVQAGLVKLWQSWGIELDVAFGVGVGQYTAACAAGGLGFLDALTLVAERERVIKQIAVTPQSLVPQEEDSKSRAEVEDALDKFESYADTINYYPPNLPLLCSLSGEVVPVHRSLAGSYWRRHCLAIPKRSACIAALMDQRCDYVVEVGPLQQLASLDERAFDKATSVRIASLTADRAATSSMLEALAQLYVGGANPDFRSFDRPWSRNRVTLPPYPFQKKRYWITEIAEHLEGIPEPLES